MMELPAEVAAALSDLDLQRSRVRWLKLPQRITISVVLLQLAGMLVVISHYGFPTHPKAWIILGSILFMDGVLVYWQNHVIDYWVKRMRQANVAYNKALDALGTGATGTDNEG